MSETDGNPLSPLTRDRSPWLQQWADAQRQTPSPVPEARIHAMMQVLLEHQREICQYPVGSVELHFNGASLKARIVINLSSK